MRLLMFFETFIQKSFLGTDLQPKIIPFLKPHFDADFTVSLSFSCLKNTFYMSIFRNWHKQKTENAGHSPTKSCLWWPVKEAKGGSHQSTKGGSHQSTVGGSFRQNLHMFMVKWWNLLNWLNCSSKPLIFRRWLIPLNPLNTQIFSSSQSFLDKNNKRGIRKSTNQIQNRFLGIRKSYDEIPTIRFPPLCRLCGRSWDCNLHRLPSSSRGGGHFLFWHFFREKNGSH